MASKLSNGPQRGDLVVKEIVDLCAHTRYIGRCKKFDPERGWGWLTIMQGVLTGRDVFVHFSGVRPQHSPYRTLTEGEYVQFDVKDGARGSQAINVTGLFGGPLMCDTHHTYATHAR